MALWALVLPKFILSVDPESETEVAQLCLTICEPMDCSLQAPPSMGFSRQEYWSGLPFPSPRYLPEPGMNPHLPHCGQTLYHLNHQGIPLILKVSVIFRWPVYHFPEYQALPSATRGQTYMSFCFKRVLFSKMNLSFISILYKWLFYIKKQLTIFC